MAGGEGLTVAQRRAGEPSDGAARAGVRLASGDAAARRDGASRSWGARVLSFYVDGFRSMDVGRTLWVVILLKIAVLTLIATLLLPSLRKQHFANEREQTEHVLDRLTKEVSK